MRIGLTGPGGQLGQDVQKVAALMGDRVTVVPIGRDQLDLTDVDARLTTLDALSLDVLINTAAVHHVPSIEQDDTEAWVVNRDAPRALARWAQNAGVQLVHISTDYVFGADPKREAPYLETEAPNPVNRYGVTKAAGEEAVLAASSDHLVVRTASLFGVAGARGKGGNFVETMIRLARDGKALKVVEDQRMNPSHTLSVAAHLLHLVRLQASGVVHVAGGGDASWFDLARAALDRAVPDADLAPTTAAAYGDPTPRPAYSVLDLDRVRGLVGADAVEPWTRHVEQYLQAAGHGSAMSQGHPAAVVAAVQAWTNETP